jgi:hypothetical protein
MYGKRPSKIIRILGIITTSCVTRLHGKLYFSLRMKVTTNLPLNKVKFSFQWRAFPFLWFSKVKVKIKVMLRQTISQYVLVSSSLWNLWPDIIFCLKVAVLSLWGAPSDERSGLSPFGFPNYPFSLPTATLQYSARSTVLSELPTLDWTKLLLKSAFKSSAKTSQKPPFLIIVWRRHCSDNAESTNSLLRTTVVT